MQFKDPSNRKGLIEDMEFLTGLGDGNISGDANLLDQFVRLANAWYYTAVSWIWQATSTWEWDDSNLTDLPIATTTLVAGQNDYGLPGDLQKIDRVEILDSSNNYQLLEPLDKTDINQGTTEFMETDGLPQYWDLIGETVWLYPAPSAAQVTTSLGLKIYFSRDINEFTDSDTTQEPGFKPDSCHRILSYGAALDWGIREGYDTDYKERLQGRLDELEAELKEFHGLRDRSKPLKMNVRIRNYI